jgi:hypothetical protein
LTQIYGQISDLNNEYETPQCHPVLTKKSKVNTMDSSFLKVVSVTICVLIVSPVAAFARNISYNQGGYIANYQRQFDQALFKNEQYRIKGSCLSACTIFLGLPKVCVYPKALFGFHGAWPKAGNAKEQRRADARMGDYLPPRLKTLYMQTWRHNGAMSFKVLTGTQIVAIQPGLKICSDA